MLSSLNTLHRPIIHHSRDIPGNQTTLNSLTTLYSPIILHRQDTLDSLTTLQSLTILHKPITLNSQDILSREITLSKETFLSSLTILHKPITLRSQDILSRQITLNRPIILHRPDMLRRPIILNSLNTLSRTNMEDHLYLLCIPITTLSMKILDRKDRVGSSGLPKIELRSPKGLTDVTKSGTWKTVRLEPILSLKLSNSIQGNCLGWDTDRLRTRAK